MTIDELKQAGFSEDDIGQYVTDQRLKLRAAGFADSEINSGLGLEAKPAAAAPISPEDAAAKAKDTLNTAVNLGIGLSTAEKNYDEIKNWPARSGAIDTSRPGQQEQPQMMAAPETTSIIRSLFGYEALPKPENYWEMNLPRRYAFDAYMAGRSLLTRLGGAVATEAGLTDKQAVLKVYQDELVNNPKWYQKSPEALGWSAEKAMEYYGLGGIFEATGLSGVLSEAGRKMAEPFLTKEIVARGGAETLKTLSKAGLSRIGKDAVASFLRFAPENTAFLAAWDTGSAALKNEDPADAVINGSLWGVGLSALTPAAGAVGKVAIDTKAGQALQDAASEAYTYLWQNYPRLMNLGRRPFSDEFMAEAQKQYKARFGIDPTAADRAKLAQMTRVLGDEISKAAEKDVAAKAYWQAGKKTTADAYQAPDSRPQTTDLKTPTIAQVENKGDIGLTKEVATTGEAGTQPSNVPVTQSDAEVGLRLDELNQELSGLKQWRAEHEGRAGTTQYDPAFSNHLGEKIDEVQKQIDYFSQRQTDSEALVKPAFIAWDDKSLPEKVKEVGKVLYETGKSFGDMFMKVLEPAKAVENKLGGDAYATVIRGIHTPEAKGLEFDQQKLDNVDSTARQLSAWFDRFSPDELKNFMLSRGRPMMPDAVRIQQAASVQVPDELKTLEIKKAVVEIANRNYEYLQQVAGNDVTKVRDYFYGLYDNSHSQVDTFLDKFYRSTERMTKEKKLPTVADAEASGLTLRSYNPVENLRQEFIAIARLNGLQQMRDELMRTGKGKYIDAMLDAPDEWVKVGDEPVFDDLRAQPDLARLINSLISTNKVSQWPALRTIRKVNNFLRTLKFGGSAFHLFVESSQSIADSPYFKPSSMGKSFSTGFKKNDPIFETPEYRDYINLGGGHKYSIESQAQEAFSKAIEALSEGKVVGVVGKAVALPFKAVNDFTNWMFEAYIPKLKYGKYLDFVAEKERKLGRPLSDPEKINIIKEGQNFYGEMNERLFGRSGTVTSVLRFIFLAPGFAEGNYRTNVKAVVQWGQGGGFNAARSRANIINSFIFKMIAASVGTLIVTGKLPEKPETAEDIRDLFKIDTGKLDDKNRKIMLDTLTYEKDHYNVFFGFAQKGTAEVGKEILRRVGGMRAPLADITYDLVTMVFGKEIYDFKGDRVIKNTDPVLVKLRELALHELEKTEPISLSVFRNAYKKGLSLPLSIVEAAAGVRPTITEKDLRRAEVIRDIWDIYGDKETVYQRVRTEQNPRAIIAGYNKNVHRIMDSDKVPDDLRTEYTKDLVIDADQFINNKQKDYISPAHTVAEAAKVREYLVNFGIEPVGVWEGPKELRQGLSAFTEQRRELLDKKESKTITTKERIRLAVYENVERQLAELGKGLAESKTNAEHAAYYKTMESLLSLVNNH